MRLRRFAATVGLVAAVLTFAACEEEAAGGDGGGDGAAPSVATGPVTVTPDTLVPVALTEGIYRVTWTTTDCATIKLAFVGDNGFSREKTTTLPTQSWLVTSVPDGTYQIAQVDESCTNWEIKVEKIGG